MTEKTHKSTFEDLEVYQIAREFRKAMYLVAQGLPNLEKFGLVGQIRRAAVSLTNNIAEGHGRFRYLDQIRFTLQSRGSIDDLNVCEDQNYLAPDRIAEIKEQGWRLRQVIDGYIRYLREQKSKHDTSSVREESPAYGAEIDVAISRRNDSRFFDSSNLE